MKKISVVLVTLVCAVALAIGLTACGGGNTENDANFAGNWKVVTLTDESGKDMSSMLELLDSMDQKMILVLNADDEHTASFDMAGQGTMSGTWKAKSETECEINFEGYSSVLATLNENGQLAWTEGSSSMVCEREQG